MEPVYSLNAEFTRPMWVFGMSSYDFIKIDGKTHSIACSYRFFKLNSFLFCLLNNILIDLIKIYCFYLTNRQNGKSYFGIFDCLQNSFSLLDIYLSEVDDIVWFNFVFIHCVVVHILFIN